MRKVYANVVTRLIICADDDVDIETDVINELDYDFKSTTDKAEIIDTEITSFEITDSK
jgi:hypothetical protein